MRRKSHDPGLHPQRQSGVLGARAPSRLRGVRRGSRFSTVGTERLDLLAEETRRGHRAKRRDEPRHGSQSWRTRARPAEVSLRSTRATRPGHVPGTLWSCICVSETVRGTVRHNDSWHRLRTDTLAPLVGHWTASGSPGEDNGKIVTAEEREFRTWMWKRHEPVPPRGRSHLRACGAATRMVRGWRGQFSAPGRLGVGQRFAVNRAIRRGIFHTAVDGVTSGERR
jgi:hypothetical protein